MTPEELSLPGGGHRTGDGKIALILDTSGIATSCNLRVPDSFQDKEEIAKTATKEETQSILVFANHPEERFALPLGMIKRIERIRTDQIDSVGGQEVLQYRGASLALMSLEKHVSAKPREDQPHVHVLVVSLCGREIGLIAPLLHDICNVSTTIDTVTLREPGIFGSLVLEDQTTRFVNLTELTKKDHSEWFKPVSQPGQPDHTGSKILLVEDSNFFRNQITSFLESAGYDVTPCEDGAIAWNALQDPGQTYDLVVTDIEMPNMNGLELTRKIKGDPMFAHLPVIAITSLAGEEDVQRGLSAGVNEYQIKINRDELLDSIVNNLRTAERRQEVAVGAEETIVRN